MFLLLNPPHKKRRKKTKRRAKKSIFTPGGGRILSRNPFLGINPLNRRRRSASFKGVFHMAKRRGRGRHVRFNMGSLSSMLKTPSGGRSFLDGFKPKNFAGTAPIIGGVIVSGLIQTHASNLIPYTKKGIGNIALGIAAAGITGLLGNFAGKGIGESAFIGGMVGTLGCAFKAFQETGLHSLALSGEFDPLTQGYGINGMGAFISPNLIASAIPSGGTQSQYALPASNAQFVPMQQMQVPQTPAQGANARHMADFEGAAVGAMLGKGDDGMDMY